MSGVTLTPLPALPSIDFDVGDDFAVWDGPQEIYLYRRVQEDLFLIPHAVFVGSEGEGTEGVLYNRGKEKEASFGVYLEYFGTWKVPFKYLEFGPANGEVGVNNVILTPLSGDPVCVLPGDNIIDQVNNHIWTILRTNSPRHNDPWDIKCNRLTFNLPLANNINYYSVEPDVDDYGGRNLNKILLYEDLTCRIQPIISHDELIASRIYHQTDFFIYINLDIEARIGDLIKDNKDEKFYRIVRVEDRQRIDVFTKLTAKHIQNPNEIPN